MRILYTINTGLVGGLQQHVMCLMESLKGIAETAVVVNTEIDSRLIRMFEDRGLRVYQLKGRNGHDWRIVWRLRRILEDFRPDIIHAHGLPIFCMLYLCIFSRNIPLIHSIHTPSFRPSWYQRPLFWLRDYRVAYWLPVSNATWEAFNKWYPKCKGEIFFNLIRLSDFPLRKKSVEMRGWKGRNPVVGMVGRKADVKDWPSFHKVEQLVKERMPEVVFLNAGENAVCDGREAIAQMDLFILTSKYEQLPTTVLECFAIGTPVCGFLPDGGMKDILSFSSGALRDAFIEERDCVKLSQLVLGLLRDSQRRRDISEEGWHILNNHFAAEELVPGKLMDIYRRFVK